MVALSSQVECPICCTVIFISHLVSSSLDFQIIAHSSHVFWYCVPLFKMICGACSQCSGTAHRAAYASVRPSVRVCLRLGGGRLTGRGDRIRQKLFPVRTHVHRGENRKGGASIGRHTLGPFIPPPSIPLSSLLPEKPTDGPKVNQLPCNFLAVLFLFLEWTTDRPLPAFIPRPPASPSLPPLRNEFTFSEREGEKTNVTILLVRQREGGRKGMEGSSDDRRKGGWHCTWTSEIGDE